MEGVNKASPILRGNACRVLASATVDLISRVQRPYLWKVTVTGLPPHAYVRHYDIAASTDDFAAQKGLEVFEHEMSNFYKFVEALQ